MNKNIERKILLSAGVKSSEIDKMDEIEKQTIINKVIIFTDYKLFQNKKIQEFIEKIK